MGRDHDGNIIVVEPHYQRVNHFTPEGKLVAQWGCRGTNQGCFTLPRAVAVNSRAEVFVPEYMESERVQRFALATNQTFSAQHSTSNVQSNPLTPTLSAAEGARENTNWPYTRLDTALTRAKSETNGSLRGASLLQVIGQGGTGPGEFNRAEGICVDSQDRIYIADSCNHRIQIFAADGKFLREFGHAGTKPGELSYPYDVAVDRGGNIFVCEFGNSRIQVFDANCQSIEIIGGAGGEPGKFNNPWAIALDGHGNLYVADALNHRLQELVRRSLVAGELANVAAHNDVRLRTPPATN
jgi:hypothetical protein